jgi:hypothetical protein
MHGAGRVNSYFLREGSSFVEIFPCRTGAEQLFASFREPQRIEGKVFGLSLFVRNESPEAAFHVDKPPMSILPVNLV